MTIYINLDDILNLLDSKLDELSNKIMNDDKMTFNEFARYLKAHEVIYDLREEIIKELGNGEKKTIIRYKR